jgi:hypothetical protein
MMVHLTAHRYHLPGDNDKLNWLVLSVFKIGIFNIDCTLKALLQFHAALPIYKSQRQ